MTTREAARIINAIKCSMVTSLEEHEALTMAECVLCEQEIKSASVDAPIKHGRWIYIRDEENNGLYECSECHKGDIHAKECKVSFCWNCGAKMQSTISQEKRQNAVNEADKEET